jgi:hypothetical protein
MGTTKMLLHQHSACIPCLLHPSHLSEHRVIYRSLISFVNSRVTFSVNRRHEERANSMEWSPWVPDGYSAGQEIARLLRNPGAHYRPLGSIRSVNIFTFDCFQTSINIVDPPSISKSTKWSLSFRSYGQILYSFLIFPMCAPRDAHLILRSWLL